MSRRSSNLTKVTLSHQNGSKPKDSWCKKIVREPNQWSSLFLNPYISSIQTIPFVYYFLNPPAIISNTTMVLFFHVLFSGLPCSCSTQIMMSVFLVMDWILFSFLFNSFFKILNLDLLSLSRINPTSPDIQRPKQEKVLQWSLYQQQTEQKAFFTHLKHDGALCMPQHGVCCFQHNPVDSHLSADPLQPSRPSLQISPPVCCCWLVVMQLLFLSEPDIYWRQKLICILFFQTPSNVCQDDFEL